MVEEVVAGDMGEVTTDDVEMIAGNVDEVTTEDVEELRWHVMVRNRAMQTLLAFLEGFIECDEEDVGVKYVWSHPISARTSSLLSLFVLGSVLDNSFIRFFVFSSFLFPCFQLLLRSYCALIPSISANETPAVTQYVHSSSLLLSLSIEAIFGCLWCLNCYDESHLRDAVLGFSDSTSLVVVAEDKNRVLRFLAENPTLERVLSFEEEEMLYSIVYSVVEGLPIDDAVRPILARFQNMKVWTLMDDSMEDLLCDPVVMRAIHCLDDNDATELVWMYGNHES